MAIIETVEIYGFWGDRKINLNFHEEVNFLIGRNGSGKTTVINIIAAALTGDFQSLDRLPFNKVIITLKNKESNKKPSVTVEKINNDKSPYPNIQYKIKESQSSNQTIYSLSDYAEDRFFRGTPPSRISPTRKHYLQRRDIMRALEGITSVTWLSVHRSSLFKREADRPSKEYSVDNKLSEINERLVRYFSELNAEANNETRKFQRKLFLSLIESDSEFAIFNSVEKLDLKQEKNALIDIYKRFNVPDNQYGDKVENLFHSLEVLTEKRNSHFSSQEIVHLVNAWRVHSLVDEWVSTVKNESAALQPREKLIEALDIMFNRKSTHIMNNNEIYFKSDSGKEISPFDLSSGEKQLYIILSESVLQKSKPYIYIADEPELSLHIDWQVSLVDSLKDLNTECQILFATHSPDIVSHYDPFIINMEEILN